MALALVIVFRRLFVPQIKNPSHLPVKILVIRGKLTPKMAPNHSRLIGLLPSGTRLLHFCRFHNSCALFPDHVPGNSYNTLGGSYDRDDCYCVPWDQCPPGEISRKDGGREHPLIDPRHNPNSEIQAEDIVVTDGNGTMTVVKGPIQEVRTFSNEVILVGTL